LLFMRALIVAAVIGTFAAGCHRNEARPLAVGPPAKRPSNAAECRSCKGEWGVHGLLQVEDCLCRTRDAGQRCRDGLECEGECLLQAGAVEVVEQGPPRRGFFVGKCSEFDRMFGCHLLLMDGTVARGPTALDEAPGEVCID
jgi:hypothetical protein